jgi:hypothetical protein
VGPEGQGAQQSSSPTWSWGLAMPKAQGVWQGGAGLRGHGVGIFSTLCHGESFQDLRVWSAKVSALPGTLPQLSMSPASQQGP